MLQLRAVIFDMDGTLVLTNAMHFDAYQKVFDRYGIKADFTDFQQNLIGIGAYNVIKTIFERNNMTVDYAELARIKAEIFNEMLKDTNPKPVAGLYDFLDLLHERGIKTAVGSAANKQSILEVLRTINVDSRITTVVSCEEVPRAKPSPDVFLEAARQLDVLPEQCMVIEDTSHGIQAAVAAGMTPLALLTTQLAERLTQAGARYLCRDFTEVLQLFTSEEMG